MSQLSEKEREILNELSEMAIFKMSLGSKELFHSNFLEFLWDKDNDAFKKTISKLCSSFNWQENLEYKFGREKNHFDICIYHEEKKAKKRNKSDDEEYSVKEVYDLIIENKVKSIPYKSQLEEYKGKLVNADNAKYMLLSLMENFEDKSVIYDSGWEIVHYDSLRDAIREYYREDCIYISDYCKFIDKLHELQLCIVPKDPVYLEQELYPCYDEYKKYRLHDLYIKLRGLKFLEFLKRKLEEKSIACQVVKDGGNKLRDDYKEGSGVVAHLNWNVFRAVGQIAAFIYKGDEEIYEIVIQGDQYRHGINYKNKKNNGNGFESLDNDKEQSQKQIWGKETEKENRENRKFITSEPYPEGKKKQYCGYGTDYIYRYNKLKEMDCAVIIQSLLEYMANDIEKVVNSL